VSADGNGVGLGASGVAGVGAVVSDDDGAFVPTGSMLMSAQFQNSSPNVPGLQTALSLLAQEAMQN
jgi:hypothetical protein